MYLLETNQSHERVSNNHDGDNLRLSLKDFINWHNPFERNDQQVSASSDLE